VSLLSRPFPFLLLTPLPVFSLLSPHRTPGSVNGFRMVLRCRPCRYHSTDGKAARTGPCTDQHERCGRHQPKLFTDEIDLSLRPLNA
jgi:hypothetical protein